MAEALKGIKINKFKNCFEQCVKRLDIARQVYSLTPPECNKEHGFSPGSLAFF